MAKSAADCQQMIDAARNNNRVLEIGYQRFYNPIYQAAYTNIIKQGLLGDVYFARLAWHRNATWRKTEDPPSANFDPAVGVILIGNTCSTGECTGSTQEGLLCELEVTSSLRQVGFLIRIPLPFT